MMPVIFVTDAFNFSARFHGCLPMCFMPRQHEHLRAPWHDVSSSSTGDVGRDHSCSFMLLVGLLDSVAFSSGTGSYRHNSSDTIHSTEVSSVLDLVLGDLRQNTERTYSAPLASYAFAKEMIDLPDGKQTQGLILD